MRKVLAASTVALVTVAGCSSPEARSLPIVPQEQSLPAPSPSTEIVNPAPTYSAPEAVTTLSKTMLNDILEEKRQALEQLHGANLDTSLFIVEKGKSVDCVLIPEIIFLLEGNDPMAAYNCLADNQIVVSEAFIEKQLKTKEDPVTTAQILLAHELGHSVMDAYGVDVLTADKTQAERQADCLAGSTFATLPVAEKNVVVDAFAEYTRISEDYTAREMAFVDGLDGSDCTE